MVGAIRVRRNLLCCRHMPLVCPARLVRTGRILADAPERVYAARGAFQLMESIPEDVVHSWDIVGCLFVVPRPRFLRDIYLLQIIEAGFLLLSRRLNEVGNGDSGQEADNCDNDHDFRQGECIFHRLDKEPSLFF